MLSLTCFLLLVGKRLGSRGNGWRPQVEHVYKYIIYTYIYIYIYTYTHSYIVVVCVSRGGVNNDPVHSASWVWSSFWASYSPTMEKENFKIIFCQIQVSWFFLRAAAELKTRHSLLVQQTAYFLALDTPPLAFLVAIWRMFFNARMPAEIAIRMWFCITVEWCFM